MKVVHKDVGTQSSTNTNTALHVRKMQIKFSSETTTFSKELGAYKRHEHNVESYEE